VTWPSCGSKNFLKSLRNELGRPRQAATVGDGSARWPVTFHRHEGKFTIDLENGTEVNVSGREPAQLTPELKRMCFSIFSRRRSSSSIRPSMSRRASRSPGSPTVLPVYCEAIVQVHGRQPRSASAQLICDEHHHAAVVQPIVRARKVDVARRDSRAPLVDR
jgi:hypothetical protein